MIKPLKNAAPKAGGSPDDLVTVGYFQRTLKTVLSHFGLSVKGGTLREVEPGHLHIDIPSGDGGSFPFKASTFVAQSNGRTGVLIAPGLVYSNSFGSTPWMVPVIGKRYLTADPPPALAPNGNLSFICLIAEFDTDGVAYNFPWQIDAFSSPPDDIPLIRNNSATGDPQRGKYHILIATIQDTVLHQWTYRNICINLQWEVPFISA